MIDPRIYIPLKEYLKSKKITIPKVAEMIDSHPVFLYAVLSGRKAIGRTVAMKLSDVFGFSTTWLLTGEGNMFKEDKVEKLTLSSMFERVKQQDFEIARLKQEIYNLSNTVQRLLVDEQNKNEKIKKR